VIITRKRWTTEEETYLLEVYSRLKSNGMDDSSTFAELATWDEFKVKNRTAAALQKRYSELAGANKRVINEHVDNSGNDFLKSIQDLKNSYEALYEHNVQLRKRITELEQKEADFEMMSKIMEQARRLVINEELGKKPDYQRFKMDQNGNLERV
jgi:hypothetical protein